MQGKRELDEEKEDIYVWEGTIAYQCPVMRAG
jgi:hypothetical protein